MTIARNASRILVATDLSPASEAALIRARDHASAVDALLVVCHIVPDVMRNNPLFPQKNEADVVAITDLMQRAGNLVDEQLARLGISPDRAKVIVEGGVAEEEIVRIADDERAELIVLGAKPRTGIERVLGHVAERVVRYANTPVLIARDATRTGKILVATDFSPSSEPVHAIAARLVSVAGVAATLLHVIEPAPSTAAVSMMSMLGSPYTPPPPSVLQALRQLGETTLKSLADQHRFAHVEQAAGDPTSVIIEKAQAMPAEMIVIGNRGRSRLNRLVLGSVAEAVIRKSVCSVLVARA
jgi:nucleotide-binding universal stress UspA family protein